MRRYEYLIWSFKHAQWWGPDRCGYTPHVEQAGRYTAQEACEITTSSVFVESVPICEEVVRRMGAPTVRSIWQEA